jgi:hypothetical protein
MVNNIWSRLFHVCFMYIVYHFALEDCLFKQHSLINPLMPVLVHHTVVNVFKGSVNLKPLHPRWYFEFKLQHL